MSIRFTIQDTITGVMITGSARSVLFEMSDTDPLGVDHLHLGSPRLDTPIRQPIPWVRSRDLRGDGAA